MTTEQCPSANGDAPKAPLQSSPASLPAKAQSQIKRLSSKLLLSGDSEVEIEHRGQLYRLRQTALGKLILTK